MTTLLLVVCNVRQRLVVIVCNLFINNKTNSYVGFMMLTPHVCILLLNYLHVKAESFIGRICTGCGKNN